jgi:hypothetical protein
LAKEIILTRNHAITSALSAHRFVDFSLMMQDQIVEAHNAAYRSLRLINENFPTNPMVNFSVN